MPADKSKRKIKMEYFYSEDFDIASNFIGHGLDLCREVQGISIKGIEGS